MLNEPKIAQMAAFFINKEGGRIAHLKLMKLLYLSERESIRLRGMVMSGDKFVAMPQGPVLSVTLNLMDGDIESKENGWEQWISAKENHELSLKKDINRQDLDELSDSDIEILESIWKKFGKMDKWKIRDYTHNFCSEWIDPNGSSQEIPYQQICIALGFSKQDSEKIAKNIKEQLSIDNVLFKTSQYQPLPLL